MSHLDEKQRENCRILAEFMMTLPRARLYMPNFVGTNWLGAPDLSCGTTACAAGWASTIPCLRRQGIVLRRNAYLLGGYLHDTSRLSVVFGAADRVFYMTDIVDPVDVAMELLRYADEPPFESWGDQHEVSHACAAR